MGTLTLPFIAVLTLSFPQASSAAQGLLNGTRTSCEGLRDSGIPDLRTTYAAPASSGSAICRVAGVIGKEINFELLLPEAWNGIFVMGGGGGFSGTVQNSARWTADHGYATSGTDTGHVSTASMSAAWALESPERRVNFGHLAVHRTAEVSKALIAAYYGRPPGRSYFMGCSCGGGQAMSEAQRYPDDFDGIVSGAPAYNATAIAAEFVRNSQALYPDGLSAPPLISPGHLRVLQEAVLSRCDLQDGVADGILNDPAGCGFDLSTLPRCGGGAEPCFTDAQLGALRTVYGGTDDGYAAVYPGFPFGGENEPGGWNNWITGPDRDFLKRTGYPTAQSYFGIETFRYLVLQDPGWDYLKYRGGAHAKELRRASGTLNAASTDYGGFRKRKGRMILWHGWNDPALSAYSTIEHYEAVRARDGSAGDYMRLFLLPGVLHCGGGKGPSQADWLSLIRDWVEKGEAPERVVVRREEGGKEVMSRPVFPYPDKAVYDGQGDPAKESSFGRGKGAGGPPLAPLDKPE